MSDAIIVALITGLCAIGSQLLISRQSSKELYAKLDKQSELSDAKLEKSQAVTETKLEELTREVRAHNGFAEKIPVINEQIKQLTERVSELEKNANKRGVA